MSGNDCSFSSGKLPPDKPPEIVTKSNKERKRPKSVSPTSTSNKRQNRNASETTNEPHKIKSKQEKLIDLESELSETESDMSGIISDNNEVRSDHDETVSMPNENNDVPRSNVNNDTVPKNAKIDLNNLPEIPSNVDQIIIASTDTNRKLTTFNPQKIKVGIETICGGPVKMAEYQRSGSILVTVNNNEQLNKIKNAETFPILSIPIITKIAWTNQFTYGKLWAPELQRDSLKEILDMFESQNVIGVRKLFGDPNKADCPLFVLTFLGPIPRALKLGYQMLRIEKFLPRPLQCRKCYRFGHATNSCRSKEACSRCASSTHTLKDCTSSITECINCKGTHEATDKNCPKYIFENDVCYLTADRGISFAEARALKRNNNRNPTTTTDLSASHPQNRHITIVPNTPTPTCPETTSCSQFPPLQRKILTRQKIQNPPNSQLFANYSQIAANSQLAANSQIAANSQMHAMQQTNIANSQSNLFTQHEHETQDSQDYIPPYQQPNMKTHYAPISENIFSPLHLDPPTISPQHETNLSYQQQPYSYYQQHTTQNRPTSTATNNHSYSNSLDTSTAYQNDINTQQTQSFSIANAMNSLPKLLPLLIKMIFATELTERIECITNIGHILHLGDLVTSTLSSLQLNSTTSLLA